MAKFVVSLLFLFGFASIAYGQTVAEVLASTPNLSTAAFLINNATLTATLNNTNDITVFAPNNSYFEMNPSLPPMSPTQLYAFLAYHIVSVRVPTAAFTNNQVLPTMLVVNGTANVVRINLYETPMANLTTVNGVPIVEKDIAASNGFVNALAAPLTVPTKVFIQFLQGAAGYQFFLGALGLSQTGLFMAPNVTDPYTVFLPPDTAFGAFTSFLPLFIGDSTGQFTSIVQKIVKNHVVKGSLYSAGIYQGKQIVPLTGYPITVTKSTPYITLLGVSNITSADNTVLDGVYHTISTPLIPPFTLFEFTLLSNFTTLRGALIAAGLNGTFDNDASSPRTVFAPSNDAFAALGATFYGLLANRTLLTEVLNYHTVTGVQAIQSFTNNQMLTSVAGPSIRMNVYGNGVVTANCAVINKPNVGITGLVASNGAFQGINAVLMPPTQTVAGLIASNPSLSTLAAALSNASLTTTLSGAGPFTVFAPTNTAFTALGSFFTNLYGSAQLATVLQYHALSAVACAGGFSNGDRVLNIAGANLTVSVSGGVVSVNGATVTMANLVGTNGVVHIIDKVILPPGSTTGTTGTTGAATTGAAPAATTGASSGAILSANVFLLVALLAAFFF